MLKKVSVSFSSNSEMWHDRITQQIKHLEVDVSNFGQNNKCRDPSKSPKNLNG